MPRTAAPVAWIESPLQLIGAAEWAHARGVRVDLAARLGAQVEETAAELHARRAPFAERAAYYGIPWRMLSSHDHWLVGDGFSGQFRLAATVLRPRRVTFLDDGLNTLPLVDAVTGVAPYVRPGVVAGGLSRRLAPLALDAVRLRAASGAVDVFTAFPLGDAREAALADLGATRSAHGFEWLRGSRPSSACPEIPAGRVLLGTAGVADGRFGAREVLTWARSESRRRAVTYLPHRRETDETLGALSRMENVTVVRTDLPVELVLGGSRGPYDVLTLPSSAAVTLRAVLRGTESVVRERALTRVPGRAGVA